MKSARLMTGLALLALAACSGNDVRNTLGLDRATPDEFRVVSRPPLSVPPQFDLRPPASIATADMGANQLSASDQAKALLTGGDSAAPAQMVPPVAVTSTTRYASDNSAEATFLKNAGAQQADPSVREKITQDHIIAQQPIEENSWWNFWSTANQPKKDPLVNAGQESQRIRTTGDSGQPVTTGDTPTVKDRDSGILGRIFGY